MNHLEHLYTVALEIVAKRHAEIPPPTEYDWGRLGQYYVRRIQEFIDHDILTAIAERGLSQEFFQALAVGTQRVDFWLYETFDHCGLETIITTAARKAIAALLEEPLPCLPPPPPVAPTTGVRKLRAYEVARECNVSTDWLLSTLRSLGFPIRDHMATVSKDAIFLLTMMAGISEA